MKTGMVLPTLVCLGLTMGGFAQAQSTSQLDGIWVGTEILTPLTKLNPDEQKHVPKPHKTTIAIAKGGTLLGIIDGVCPGRYQQVRRTGNTLTCGAADCQVNVTLSTDGKTLVEDGSCHYATMYTLSLINGRSWPVTWIPLRINGTFTRVK